MYEEAPWSYGATHEQAAKARPLPVLLPVLSSGACLVSLRRACAIIGVRGFAVVSLLLAVCFAWRYGICCQAKVLLKAIDAISETALQSRPTFLAVKAGWVGGLGLAVLEVRPVVCSAAQPVRPVVCSAAQLP